MIVHTILYVANQKKSTDFYSFVLGMKPSLDVPGMTQFKLSDKHILGLMPESGIKKLLGEKLPDPSQANGIPRVEVYFKVDDPESFLMRAMACGSKELSSIQPRDWAIVPDTFLISMDMYWSLQALWKKIKIQV